MSEMSRKKFLECGRMYMKTKNPRASGDLKQASDL